MSEFRTMILGEIFLIISSVFLLFNVISTRAKSMLHLVILIFVVFSAIVLAVKIKLLKK